MNEPRNQALGVGSLMSRMFGLYFRHFGLFFVVAFLPLVAFQLVSTSLVANLFIGSSMEENWVGVLVIFAIYALIYALVVGVITMSAFDLLNGRRPRLRQFISRVMSSLGPIVLLTILVAVLLGIVLLAVVFILGGLAFAGGGFFSILMVIAIGFVFLYGIAATNVMMPAILIEPAGFRGLKRSLELTKGYRWPIIGALLVVLILLALVSVAIEATASYFVLNPGSVGALTQITMAVLTSLAETITYSVMAVFSALLYSRLREIKEGISFRDLSDIFE